MYIDSVHYTVQANDIVAGCITDAIMERGVVADVVAHKAGSHGAAPSAAMMR